LRHFIQKHVLSQTCFAVFATRPSFFGNAAINSGRLPGNIGVGSGMGGVEMAEATCIGNACILGEMSSWPTVEIEHQNRFVSVAISGSCADYK